MKKFICLIFAVILAMGMFSIVSYAEDGVIEIGATVFEYDSAGNVSISGYYVTKEEYELFLEEVGSEYSVTSITIKGMIDGIETEAFLKSASTIKELTFGTRVRSVGFNIFGEEHSVKFRYSGNETYWNNMYKQNDDEYFGDVEFCIDGYALCEGIYAEAYNDIISGNIFFEFVESDCVAKIDIFDYTDSGETVLNTTFTKEIKAMPNQWSFSHQFCFDFESDGKDHLISVTLYDNLTDKNQWGETQTRDFFAHDNVLVCESASAAVNNSSMNVNFEFLFVKNDSVVLLEIFDYDENGELVKNSEMTFDVRAAKDGKTFYNHIVPFKCDNKYHFAKFSFYDNMTDKNELFDSQTCEFYADQSYDGMDYDYIDDSSVKITGSYNSNIYLPIKINDYWVTEIAEEAFLDNSYIEEIIIHEKISKISKDAFKNAKVPSVKYIGTEEQWNEIVIEEGNEGLKNAPITFNYSKDLVYGSAQLGSYGKDYYVDIFFSRLYKDCLAKIELRDISLNETTVIYEEISLGTTQKTVNLPVLNYGDTYYIYFSIESPDKSYEYMPPDEIAFFTPESYDEIIEEGDFGYVINENGEAEIVGSKSMEASLTIPDTLGGYPVTALKSWALCGFEITELRIGKNLKSIGYGALTYTFMLENIIVDSENDYFVFENGVLYNKDKTKIVHYLLTNTAEKFEMPESVEIVGAHAFEANENLKEIVLSKNLTTLERQAFAYSTITGELILPEKVKSIGSEALNCEVTKIYIPKAAENIAIDAVAYCSELKEIEVSEENEKYSSENGILYNKEKTVLFKYPAQKEEYSFIISDTVETISEGAFSCVPNLAKLTLSKSIKRIKNNAMSDWEGLKVIFYTGTQEEYDKVSVAMGNHALMQNLVVGTKTTFDDGSYEYEITPTNTAIVATPTGLSGYVVLPEEINGIPVDTIGKFSFRNCGNITELEFSRYIKTFNATYSFEGLTSLERFVVNEENKIFKADENGILYNFNMKNLVRIPQNASLGSEFVIPDNVELVSGFAFAKTKFNKIKINKNLKGINSNSFVDMLSLKEFIVNNNENFVSKDGVLYTADMQTLISYPAGKAETTFTVPETVKTIGDNAFRGSWGLQSVNLPSDLKTIGAYAFYDCAHLQNITIPSGVTKINQFTFCHCIGLTNITFSNTMTDIKENAFKNCMNLQIISYIGTEEEYKKINIHESNTELLSLTPNFSRAEIAVYSQTVSGIEFMPMNLPEPADILIAYYKNGILDTLEKREYCPEKVESVTFDAAFNPEYDTIKIMAWNNIAGLKALCKPLVIGKQ